MAFAVRFETRPGEQAQVDFAQFRVGFTAEPGVVHIVWLFSIVLGYSRLIWRRCAPRQTMQTVLACHKAAFEAFGSEPRQIRYDRMKTAVIGEDADGQAVYNRTLGDLAHHYGCFPNACHLFVLKRRAKSNGPSATSGRTSSSAVSFAISTISICSSKAGWVMSPIPACMQRPAGS